VALGGGLLSLKSNYIIEVAVKEQREEEKMKKNYAAEVCSFLVNGVPCPLLPNKGSSKVAARNKRYI
jgi:hypothetical protein